MRIESERRWPSEAPGSMAGIFLLQGGRQLVELREQVYESEALLQELLANHPNLLAGDQVNRTVPRRWLLVSREMSVPGEPEGGARWSLDHLFLDQDGIPTLVEVKRSTDTRIRREVVGQILDYAANGVVYWPSERLQAQFEVRCQTEGRDPDQVLVEALGPEINAERFWQDVKTNLQAGRVRLIFVADEIPPELQRVVEFLNEQMVPAEVLAIEIKQYVGQGVKTLIPRVLGQTAAATLKKGAPASEGKQWDDASFFQELKARQAPQEVLAARRILEWAQTKQLRISWGRGRIYGSYTVVSKHGDTTYSLATVFLPGSVQIPFQVLAGKPPFDDEGRRQELLRRLNEIPGVEFPPDAISRFPTIRLSTLSAETAIKAFLAALEWAVGLIPSA